MHLCQKANSRSVIDASRVSFARCRTPEALSPLWEANETQRQGVPFYGSITYTEMAGKRTLRKFRRTQLYSTRTAEKQALILDGECL